MTKRMQFRQGDVLIERIASKNPTGTESPVEAVSGRLVLAYGEATGHSHSLDAGSGTLTLDEGGVMFLTVEELTAVEHQEHNPVTLEPGTYRVTRQREYTPERIVNVSD